MHRHPRLRAWTREEDGSYKAEIDGATLHVTWRPESKDARRGFAWKVEAVDGTTSTSVDVEEEIEAAMVAAEDRARLG